MSPSPGLPTHYRRNFLALTGDAGAYVIAMAFVELITVMPLFFEQVCGLLKAQGWTGFAANPRFWTGLAVAIRSGGWLVPQFFSARTVAASPRKKPLLLTACWIGRLPFLLVSVYLLAGSAATHPATALFLAISAWSVFSICEGFAGVPWMFLISVAIPARRRGHLFGWMQILGGAFAVGAGWLVKRILEPHGLSFPQNFGVLFGLMFSFLMVSQAFLMMIREPETKETLPAPPPLRTYLRQMPGLLHQSAAFRWMMGVQVLGGSAALATPLYTLFARDKLHVAPQMAGSYLSIEMAGTVAASLLWGYVSDHHGPRMVVRMNLVASLLSPGLALMVALLFHSGAVSQQAAGVIFGLSFFMAGAAFSGIWAGYNNYLLETVPESRRAEYVGLMNTLAGPVVLFPLLGEWLAGILSGPAVFALASLGCIVALCVSIHLPPDEGREKGSATYAPKDIATILQ